MPPPRCNDHWKTLALQSCLFKSISPKPFSNRNRSDQWLLQPVHLPFAEHCLEPCGRGCLSSRLHLVQLELSVPCTWRSGDRTPAFEERRKPLGGGPPPTGPSPHPPIRNRPARRLRVCFTETAKEPPAERSRASGRVTPLRPCSLSRSLREGEAESPRRSSRQPMLSRRLPWNAASRFHFPAAPVTPSAPTAEGESSLPSARKRLHSGIGECRREAPGNPISRKVTLSARKHLGRYRLESNEGDSAG